MDRPAIHAAEAFVHAGYPLEVEAMLIVELDGAAAEVDHLIAQVEAIARGTTPPRSGQPRRGRAAGIWSGRKAAFAAMGGSRPTDTAWTAPSRHALAQVLRHAALSEHYGLGFSNVFHAGDGNLHPLILYDTKRRANSSGPRPSARYPAAVRRGRRRAHRRAWRRRGKARSDGDDVRRDRSGTPAAPQMRLRSRGLFNPGKVFPQLHRCAELGKLHVHRG